LWHCCCKLVKKSCNIKIASLLFEPQLSLSVFQNEITNPIEKLDPFDKVIIAGDFNARCTSFGDDTDSSKSNFLMQAIINDGSPTFRRNIDAAQGSVWDLTFVNGIQSREWLCDSIFLGGSHHHPITFKIIEELTKTIIIKKRKKIWIKW